MDMIGVNTLGAAHYGQHFVIDIFKSILSKNISILLLCFHGSFFIYMKYILVPVMAWYWAGNEPLIINSLRAKLF